MAQERPPQDTNITNMASTIIFFFFFEQSHELLLKRKKKPKTFLLHFIQTTLTTHITTHKLFTI